ncbi:MAG TPA: hypothetical protein DEA32_00005 [Firmicutes bacterium]|nr:hypothetical protein [Bacillota bacterium]
MKKRCVIATGLAVLTFGLASCSIIGSIGDIFDRFSSTSYEISTDLSTPSAQRSIINRVDATAGIRSMPSIGDVNLLVVPVSIKGFASQISDSQLGRAAGFKDGESWRMNVQDPDTGLGSVRSFKVDWLSTIEKSFFGSGDDTGYESVSSFYRQSSYQKLRIAGTVTPVFETEQDYNTLLARVKKDGAKSVTDSILKDVYDEFFGGGYFKVSDFDGDRDGVIDGIWLVYDMPDYSLDTNLLDSDFAWAYTTNYGDETSWPSENKMSAYCWASKWFLTNGIYAQDPYVDSAGNLLADSHTFIHETGHMLGLNDYYDTSSGDIRSPAAGLIMMDHNVFDQDPYTKYLLGWIDPKHYQASDLANEATLNLRPFEASGDAIVLDLPGNDGWVGEEYVILAYWTPTGLNEVDATNPYLVYGGTREYSGLNRAGVMAFHVDSRFMQYRAAGGKWQETGFASLDQVMSGKDDSSTEAYLMAFDNSSSDITADNVQLEMIDASNRFYHMQVKSDGNPRQVAADNSFLFHSGQTYSSAYTGLRGAIRIGFHGADTDGVDKDLQLGLKVEFGEQDSAGAALTISRS